MEKKVEFKEYHKVERKIAEDLREDIKALSIGIKASRDMILDKFERFAENLLRGKKKEEEYCQMVEGELAEKTMRFTSTIRLSPDDRDILFEVYEDKILDKFLCDRSSTARIIRLENMDAILDTDRYPSEFQLVDIENEIDSLTQGLYLDKIPFGEETLYTLNVAYFETPPLVLTLLSDGDFSLSQEFKNCYPILFDFIERVSEVNWMGERGRRLGLSGLFNLHPGAYIYAEFLNRAGRVVEPWHPNSKLFLTICNQIRNTGNRMKNLRRRGLKY